jgi:hypothetical protein
MKTILTKRQEELKQIGLSKSILSFNEINEMFLEIGKKPFLKIY